LLLKKEKVTENTVTTSLAAWLPFDQISCEFENIGVDAMPPLPIGASLILCDSRPNSLIHVSVDRAAISCQNALCRIEHTTLAWTLDNLIQPALE